jgi:hypothetical protein
MAAPFSDTAKPGADLNGITLAADLANGKVPDARLGTQVFASNGKIYVYCQASAAITASTAVCTVPPTTFLATATGGAYLSPAVTMATGDRGWFSRAGV